MASGGAAQHALPEPPEHAFRLLYLGPFISYVDRFAIPPVLLSVARDLDVSVAAATTIATLYFFSYGAMQLFWGLLSDRAGRVRVMRWALAGMALGNIVASAAPTLVLVLAGKSVAGAFAAALLPASLVYVADKVPFARRQRTVANVMAAGAVGTITGIVASGLFSRLVTWRLTFLLTVPVGLALVVAFRRLAESLPGRPAGGSLAQLRRVFARRWARFLLALAVAEGAVVLGFVTFLAPALEAQGHSSAVAGLVVATYGVAVLVGSQAVKGVVRRGRASPPGLVATGGALLLAGYLLAAGDQAVPNVLAASVLVGSGFALLHSTLQTWATELAPDARGAATSLFVTAVFTGAAIGSGAVSGLADAGRYRAVFLVAAAVTVPVAVLASLGRSRYKAPPVPASAPAARSSP